MAGKDEAGRAERPGKVQQLRSAVPLTGAAFTHIAPDVLTTNSQALHDQPEKDLRGARAALSIVPYSSGAAGSG